MSELTEAELDVAERMGLSPEQYAAGKRPSTVLSPEDFAFGAYLAAEALGISREDFVKHAKIVIIKDGE